MKPRSSSAEISRWMPDFDLSCSASFISSKLGEKPVCLQMAIDIDQQLVLFPREHGAGFSLEV